MLMGARWSTDHCIQKPAGRAGWRGNKPSTFTLLAGCLCAEHSPEPLPPTPSDWAHCTSRPHLVPDGWFFTCCYIVSLWPEKQTVFSHRSAFPAWIKTNPNENKMEQNNASSSEAIFLQHIPSLHLKHQHTHTHAQCFWSGNCTVSAFMSLLRFELMVAR